MARSLPRGEAVLDLTGGWPAGWSDEQVADWLRQDRIDEWQEMHDEFPGLHDFYLVADA